LCQGLDLLGWPVERKQMRFHQGCEREAAATIGHIHLLATAQTQHPPQIVLLFGAEQNRSTLIQAIRRQE
jgi:hypothetical protein